MERGVELPKRPVDRLVAPDVLRDGNVAQGPVVVEILLGRPPVALQELGQRLIQAFAGLLDAARLGAGLDVLADRLVPDDPLVAEWREINCLVVPGRDPFG